MWRIRIFRVLLPLGILGFVVALWTQIEWTETHIVSPDAGESKTSVAGGDFIDYLGDEKKGQIKILRGIEDTDGTYRSFGLAKMEISRSPGQSPIFVEAPESVIRPVEGGKNRIDFEKGVTIEDPDLGLTLRVPTLNVDPADGTARSPGAVVLEGRDLNGGASKLIYGLEGQPTELENLDLRNGADGRLKSSKALLHDGLHDMEFVGNVELRGKDASLDADWMRVQTSDNVLRHVSARGRIAAEIPGLAGLRAVRLEVDWNQSGDPLRLVLDEDAVLTGSEATLGADRIDARRTDDGFSLDAVGSVAVEGTFGGEPGWLRSQRLAAQLGPAMNLTSATASGDVRYDGRATRAEATEATYDASSNVIQWNGTVHRKARLARDAIRVAAMTLALAGDGRSLHADGGVEATLLSQTGQEASGGGLFREGEAVHFVADRLESTESGAALEFSGSVRGWQGSRNLTADRVSIRETARTVLAAGQVHSRFPRASGEGALHEQDYIQVSADHLIYTDSDRIARFEGAVRTRLAEGWIESELLEVRLGGSEQSIDQVIAAGSVKLEFRNESETGAPQLIAGESDRLIYSPQHGEIRLIGERKPAAVRRLGPAAANTQGRVLVYDVETGSLEVEADAAGPATIEGAKR